MSFQDECVRLCARDGDSKNLSASVISANTVILIRAEIGVDYTYGPFQTRTATHSHNAFLSPESRARKLAIASIDATRGLLAPAIHSDAFNAAPLTR